VEGLEVVREASRVLDVPVVLLTYPEGLAVGAAAPEEMPPMLPLHLHLAHPWDA